MSRKTSRKRTPSPIGEYMQDSHHRSKRRASLASIRGLHTVPFRRISSAYMARKDRKAAKQQQQQQQAKERERYQDLEATMEPTRRRQSAHIDEKDLEEVPLTEEGQARRKSSIWSATAENISATAGNLFGLGSKNASSNHVRNNSSADSRTASPRGRRRSSTVVVPAVASSSSAAAARANDRVSGSPAPHENDNVDIIPKSFEKRTENEIASMQRHIKRKLDLRVMPMLIILGFLNALCKLSLGKVKVLNKEAQWGVTKDQWWNAEIIASIVSIVWSAFSTTILSRVHHPNLYLSIWAMITGIMTTCLILIRNNAGLVTIVLLHGITSVVFHPGAILYLSCWYTRRQLPLRIALYILGPTLAYCFAGIISVKCAQELKSMPGLDGSKWFLCLVGVVTIVFGMISAFALPRWPRNAFLLSDEERELTIYNMANDGNSVVDGDEHQSGWRSLWRTVIDFKLYVLAFIALLLLAAAGISPLFPSIVNDFDWNSRYYKLLLTVPPYIVGWLVSVVFAVSAGYSDSRWRHITIALFLTLIGDVILLVARSRDVLYAGTFFVVAGTETAAALFVAWVCTIIPRPRAKRASAIGLVMAIPALIVAIVHIATRSARESREKAAKKLGSGLDSRPHLIHLIIITVATGLTLIFVLLLRLWMRSRNKKFAKGEGLDGDREAFRGKDGRNVKNGGKIGFRYAL